MGIAAGTSALTSFGKSIYDYDTWDRLSIDDKIAKLQEKYNKTHKDRNGTVRYNKDLDARGGLYSRYDTWTGDIEFNIFSLKSKSEAFSVLRHEMKHHADNKVFLKMNMKKTGGYMQWNLDERNAFNTQFENFNADGINLHQYKRMTKIPSHYYYQGNSSHPLTGVIIPKPSLIQVLRNIY